MISSGVVTTYSLVHSVLSCAVNLMLSSLLCRILPQRTILRLSKFVGLDTAMNTFVGHAKRQ